MGLTTTLMGVAAGAAVVNAIARRRVDEAMEPLRMPAHALPADELETCPACGTDAASFAFEEEVDAAGSGIEVVRCPWCGWKDRLAPL